MIRSLVNSKYSLSMWALVLLLALSAAGCGTTFLEKSGNMPNQNTSKHVKGYQMGDSDAVKPAVPLPILK